MIEFFNKSESRGNKIVSGKSIRITKSMNLLEFRSVGTRNYKGRFSVSSQVEKYSKLH